MDHKDTLSITPQRGSEIKKNISRCVQGTPTQYIPLPQPKAHF